MMKEVKRICLISHYNQYESKQYFATKFTEALERQGIEVFHVNVQGGILTPEILISIVQFKSDLTCSFNTLLPLKEGTYLWDYLHIPHWSILVDPAIYSTGLINSPYSIISCVDQEDIKSITDQSFNNCFFFPHAVEKELIDTGRIDKIYDVVFIGSCYDYESLHTLWKDEHPAAIDKLILDASKMVLSDNSTSIAEALCKTWENSGLSKDINFFELFYFIDRYTRGKDRVELIRAIKDAKVHVFGDISQDDMVNIMDWKQYLGDNKNVVLHPGVTYQESLQILKQSKISLNSMPFFKKGSHERVFNALACGALPLTAETLYWKDHFALGKELVCYRPGHWEEANDTINHYLANDTLRQSIVSLGASKIQEFHTWDSRAKEALQILPALLTKKLI